MKAQSVLVVDDHPLFRAGLCGALDGVPELRIVGEAADMRDACALAAKLEPQLVVLDISLPATSGITGLHELVRASPRSRIVILTVHADAASVELALAGGALGYLLKDQEPAEIVEALRKAATKGQRCFAPRLLSGMRDADINVAPRVARRSVGGPFGRLSRREREILDLLVRGHSNVAIGRQLFISVKTVVTHRANILKKLQLHSLADLVRFAARHGHTLD